MKAVFLSCDWGTSSFRLRLVNTDGGQVMAQSQSDEGVNKVYEQCQEEKDAERIPFYQAVLYRHIQAIEAQVGYSLAGTTIVASGMASSSIGMVELPYKQAPFLASGADLHYEVMEQSKAFPYAIILISGVRTQSDVMRGEETQLAGCAIASIGKQVFIFPGTHSKHVWVEDGLALDFQTYMTGELFQLLATKSILSKSVAGHRAIMNENDKAAFEQGVLAAQKHSLLHAAFTVRTNDLFEQLSKEQNYWYLSGLLIGAELTTLIKQNAYLITLVGEGTLLASYKAAYAALGRYHVQSINVSDAVVQAHAAFFSRIS